MSKRGSSAAKSKQAQLEIEDGSDMVKAIKMNKFPALLTLAAFFAFGLLVVFSQGGHERVLRYPFQRVPKFVALIFRPSLYF
jgi:hypothetical protein